jgi:hypothetical protein
MFAIGLVAGIAAGGTIVALLHNYPKSITVVQSYCVECGFFTEQAKQHVVLGAERSSRMWRGMFATLVSTGPPNHEHHWVEPWAHVFPSDQGPPLGTEAALHDALLRAQLRELEVFDHTPQYVVVLNEAIQQDKAKASAFIARILDLKNHYPAAVVDLLSRDGSWEERWAAVDAFVAAHRCIESPQAVQCTLLTNGKPQVVFEMTAQGAGRRSMPSLRSWKPPDRD